MLTRQRGSSRGSRHGSHSSSDSRKKSKTASPTRSPTRSLSQPRSTPMRSESFKENQRELTASGGGGAHVYGGSQATSTFGSHLTTPLSQSVPTSAGFSVPDGATSQPSPVQPQALATSVVTSVAAPYHTPQIPGPHTPGQNSSRQPQLGVGGANHVSYVQEQGGHTPTSSRVAVSQTPTPVATSGCTLAQLYEGQSPALQQAHTPLATQRPMYVPSPSPGLHTLSQTPVYEGSQSSVYTGGSQTPVLSGSQNLSAYGASGGSLTPPPSTLQTPYSNNTSQYNTLTSTAHSMNNTQYHQLVESQRHTPVTTAYMDPAVAAESTPL